MKLSVATFRAGTERLNALRRKRAPVEELPRRVNSLDFSDQERGGEPRTPRSATILGIFEFAQCNKASSSNLCKDSVECGMMVDGSPRRISPPLEPDSNTQQQPKTPNDTTAPSVSPPVSSGTPSVDPSGDVISRTSRSRWMKLRTTVQLSGAITQVHKKPPLKREDSFLKRFSTRQIPDPSVVEGSSRRGHVRGPFFGTWRSVVNPDENILFYWLCVLTVCLLYNAWTIIIRQAFPELQEPIAWYFLDSLTDLVFVLDIAFQFRTGYLEQGLMVCESQKLAGHYFRSKSFLMDILAITPLDLLQIKVGVLPILRFPRFLKLYRSFRFYYMVESRTIYPNLWRVVNLVHILLLLAHWFGCFYYMLSELQGFVGEWSYRKPVGDYATLTRKYLGSVYWSTLTLTTIGDLATPVTNLQYLFTIISYLIGVFIFATIVGQVGNVITNRNASRLEFERLLDGAKLYMRHHKVPRNMQRRVQRWYDYSWSRGRMQGGGDINSALGILPDKLKTELALHVNLKTLKKVSIFQECQPEFLHDLVLKMKAYIFTPGDLICRKGEVAREMFIIADGILEVISETGKVLTQMKAGDFFGEIGILNLDGFNRRTADVRSVGYSELFSLSREDILAAMKDYPEAQEILQTMGRKRLMEARLAANVGKSGAIPADPNPPKKEGGMRKGQPKPRTAVSKLKNDVRSLKKLLRTRSTPSSKGSEGEEQVEMKLIPAHQEESSSTETPRHTARRRHASIKMLMRKMHLRGEEGSSTAKGGGGLSSVVRPRPSECVSTETPLLQRVRMLGEQERRAAPATEVIGEGLPFLERLKLLRAKEQAQAAEAARLAATKEEKLSPKSKNSSSVVGPKLSPPPKKEGSRMGPDYSGGEIPLLKKVLLMKIMEDKKTDEEYQKSSEETGQSAADIASEKVFLEQFSRTLGFQMSEDAPAKPQPRARLNALSLTPSPSKENLAEEKQQAAEEEKKKKCAQTQVRKGRLSRMMAVREDSYENSIEEEDPFVKSTEVQTEQQQQQQRAIGEEEEERSPLEDGIQDYLLKVMHNMKLAMKAYIVEQEQEQRRRIAELECAARQKDELIQSLRLQIKRQQVPRASSTFDEVSSIDPSSFSDAEDNDSLQQLERGAEEEEEEDRDLDEEEARALQEKLRKQRKSWPCSVSLGRRKQLLVAKKSCSLDDQQTPPSPAEEASDLWKLEFLATAAPPTLFSPIPERAAESLPDSEEESDALPDIPEPDSNNDWEVRMLVQEFERNVRRRRHSSGEALTWDRVLRLRRGGTRHHRRKYSLVEGPLVQQGGSPGMSRWLSLDGAPASDCSSLQTSSAGSQETVVAVGPFRDVRRGGAAGVPRSPSSPNFVADRDGATSFEWAPNLPEWPSSPCLPTISEDGRTAARSASLSALVPPPVRHRTLGRSDCLASDPLSAVVIAIPDCEPLLSP